MYVLRSIGMYIAQNYIIKGTFDTLSTNEEPQRWTLEWWGNTNMTELPIFCQSSTGLMLMPGKGTTVCRERFKKFTPYQEPTCPTTTVVVELVQHPKNVSMWTHKERGDGVVRPPL